MKIKILLLLTSAICNLGLLQAASAADMPVKAPIHKAPIAVPAYDWSGWYVGAHIGGAWSNSTITNSNLGTTSWNLGGTGFISGLQTGYNFQAGNFLYGIEGDFDWRKFAGPSSPIPTALGLVQASANNSWIATAAARFGITSDRLLVYGKIGGGWARSGAALNVVNGGTIWAGSHTDGGWLVGTGIEYAFASNWTGKLEYDYIGLGNSNVSAPPAVTVSHAIQMLKVGLNYQIGNRAPAAGSAPSGPEAQDTEALARASQNPIANMISLPFQNNTNFNVGPFNRTQDILNIQPVLPMSLNSDWNLISRTIIPLISQPNPIFDSNTNGIGDITQSLFFAPVNPGPVIWGVGPVYTMPSASDLTLGTGKVLAGPTAVALITPGHWVIGVLVNNQWSVAGDPNRAAVNTFLAQPFVNYNMAGGWFLSYSPIITANWNAPSGQKWTVPVGGGLGRVFKVDDQAYNASVQVYYNAIRPNNTADWNLRVSLALLFPK
jgi:opacity protein-like surface antigen